MIHNQHHDTLMVVSRNTTITTMDDNSDDASVPSRTHSLHGRGNNKSVGVATTPESRRRQLMSASARSMSLNSFDNINLGVSSTIGYEDDDKDVSRESFELPPSITHCLSGEVRGKKRNKSKTKTCQVHLDENSIVLNYKKGHWFGRREMEDPYVWSSDMVTEVVDEETLRVVVDPHADIEVVIKPCEADVLSQFILRAVWRRMFHDTYYDAVGRMEEFKETYDDLLGRVDGVFKQRREYELELQQLQMEKEHARKNDDGDVLSEKANKVEAIRVMMERQCVAMDEMCTMCQDLYNTGTELRTKYEMMLDAIATRMSTEVKRQETLIEEVNIIGARAVDKSQARMKSLKLQVTQDLESLSDLVETLRTSQAQLLTSVAEDQERRRHKSPAVTPKHDGKSSKVLVKLPDGSKKVIHTPRRQTEWTYEELRTLVADNVDAVWTSEEEEWDLMVFDADFGEYVPIDEEPIVLPPFPKLMFYQTAKGPPQVEASFVQIGDNELSMHQTSELQPNTDLPEVISDSHHRHDLCLNFLPSSFECSICGHRDTEMLPVKYKCGECEYFEAHVTCVLDGEFADHHSESGNDQTHDVVVVGVESNEPQSVPQHEQQSERVASGNVEVSPAATVDENERV